MATETAVFAVRLARPCFSWASCTTFCHPCQWGIKWYGILHFGGMHPVARMSCYLSMCWASCIYYNSSVINSRLCHRRCIIMNSTKHWLSDMKLVPPPGELLRNIVVLNSGPLVWKHDIIHRSEPGPQATCTKIWWSLVMWFSSYASGQTTPPRGEVIITSDLLLCCCCRLMSAISAFGWDTARVWVAAVFWAWFIGQVCM